MVHAPVALSAVALSTAAAYGWGSQTAYGPLLYVWVTLFVFYVFNRGAAFVYLALMAAGYALALALEDPAENPLDGLDRDRRRVCSAQASSWPWSATGSAR